VCLDDLRVLGKSDFKALLKWRLKLREYKESLLQANKQHKEEREW